MKPASGALIRCDVYWLVKRSCSPHSLQNNKENVSEVVTCFLFSIGDLTLGF
jgi:hypothetical protein